MTLAEKSLSTSNPNTPAARATLDRLISRLSPEYAFFMMASRRASSPPSFTFAGGFFREHPLSMYAAATSAASPPNSADIALSASPPRNASKNLSIVSSVIAPAAVACGSSLSAPHSPSCAARSLCSRRAPSPSTQPPSSAHPTNIADGISANSAPSSVRDST